MSEYHLLLCRNIIDAIVYFDGRRLDTVIDAPFLSKPFSVGDVTCSKRNYCNCKYCYSAHSITFFLKTGVFYVV